MTRAEALREDTKEKSKIIKDLLIKGFSLEDIQKEFKKMKITIRDIGDFIILHPEYFEGIGFTRRKK